MVTRKQSARKRPARAMIAGILLAAALPATAQDDPSIEGPALEFRTNVPWARLKVEGNPSIEGLSPLRVPGPLTGSFWLSAAGPGVEMQRGRIQVALDENGSRIASYGRAPLQQTFVRGAVFAGFPQLTSHEPVKGAMFAVAGAGALAMTLFANDDVQEARDRRESLAAELSAVSDPGEAAILFEELRDARAEEGHLRDRRDLFLATTAGIWGVSLFDALVFGPRFEVTQVDGSSLTVSLRRKTRGQALARSLVFPGLGQEYVGQRRKSFWLGTGGAISLSYVLWRQDEVSRAEAHLREALQRDAELGTTASEAALDGRRRELEDSRGERTTALRIALAYWGLSLMDTALSFGEPWGATPVTSESGLGLRVDPARRAVAASVRF